jgi:hypothetical protein
MLAPARWTRRDHQAYGCGIVGNGFQASPLVLPEKIENPS